MSTINMFFEEVRKISVFLFEKNTAAMNIFYVFLHKRTCCWYSLEVPQRGTSNEYPNMFSLRR